MEMDLHGRQSGGRREIAMLLDRIRSIFLHPKFLLALHRRSRFRDAIWAVLS
jgi:hypothetical protein